MLVNQVPARLSILWDTPMKKDEGKNKQGKEV